jgi:two-component system cell cycle sensor histidine kinase/response regulator CckA
MTDAFREVEERHRRLVENAQDIIYDCDPMGHFTYVNPISAKLMGVTAEELIGKHFLTLIREDFREQAAGFYQKQLIDRTLNTYLEFPARTKDGRDIWIGQHVQLVYVGKRIAGFQAIARDITRQKAAEEQLRHAQKIDAVGQLAAGIAHNFNNMLTAMLGFTELVLERPSLDDLSRSDLTEVLRAGERASVLTRQMLAFARKQIRQPEVVDLNQIAADTTAMLSGLLRENIKVACLFLPVPAWIEIDPTELEQVLINLALNSRDAMPKGGRIDIAISLERLSPAAGEPDAEYVRLRFTDNGTGMAAAVRERVFEPFFTTKEPGQGTGLGLSFVHGIINESKGFISVDSEPGRGTTFTMDFPTVTSLPAPAQAADVSAPRSVNKTILLVEDEDTVRAITSRLLGRYGFRVLLAASPSEAVTLFEQHRSEIDLLLTDIVMPEMDGPELAHQLVSISPNLPVLFMSGYSGMTTDDVQSQPNRGFLSKPFTAAALTTAVHEILARE